MGKVLLYPCQRKKQPSRQLLLRVVGQVYVSIFFMLSFTKGLLKMKINPFYFIVSIYLILEPFCRIWCWLGRNSILFSLKSAENLWYSDDFRENRSWLIHLNLFNIRSEIWRWSFSPNFWNLRGELAWNELSWNFPAILYLFKVNVILLLDVFMHFSIFCSCPEVGKFYESLYWDYENNVYFNFDYVMVTQPSF